MVTVIGILACVAAGWLTVGLCVFLWAFRWCELASPEGFFGNDTPSQRVGLVLLGVAVWPAMLLDGLDARSSVRDEHLS